MAEFFVGTSGWSYSTWRYEGFYPQDLPSRRWLPYYAGRFNTAEVNYSFYHLPRATTYTKWYDETPDRFVFALKASRTITHVKFLKSVKREWKKFAAGALGLKDKLGPILIQFPPRFHATAENLKRIAKFLDYAADDQGLRLAFEFRHASCFERPMLTCLENHRAALVIAHSSRYPVPEVIATAPFVYFRFHGPKEIFASSYSDAQLKDWARHMKRFLDDGRDVYAYFNNDNGGHAFRNARTLNAILTGR
jgi:uncharacterized protein YecE (DUF72 family)